MHDFLGALNALMIQPYQINSHWLEYLKNKEDLLVKYDLLAPSFYADLDPKEARVILFKVYGKHSKKKNSFFESIKSRVDYRYSTLSL
jgi:hypothetical protein